MPRRPVKNPAQASATGGRNRPRLVGFWPIAFVAGCLLACTSASHSLAAPGPCEPSEPVAVASIGAMGDLALQDGRVLRLTGLDLSDPPPGEGDWPGFLARLTRDAALRISAPAGPDRWGRIGAQLFVKPQNEPSEVSLQLFLLQIGAARLALGAEAETCLRPLREAERQAREARQGLWSDPESILAADRIDKILTKRGKAAIIEGLVTDIGQTNAVFYLNFGHSRHKDFAVLIVKRQMKRFEKSGMTPASLVGKRLRVRGIVDGTGAPRIEASRPEQIEVMD